jgi:5'-nucleotidase
MFRRIGSLAAIAVALVAPPVAGQDGSYDILLTNDDGIESPGLQTLAAELERIGRVHVVAPCGQQSGSSMSVALRNRLELRPVVSDGRELGHCVDTTPAGAVLLAITTLAPEGGFDLVVSGINQGANVGAASHMSGTIGAAMMAAFHGVPAVAASLQGSDFGYPSRFVATFIETMRAEGPAPGLVLSINFPTGSEEETAGVEVAPMGGMHFSLGFDDGSPGEDGRIFAPRLERVATGPAGSDTEAFLDGMITITPLLFDWTATAAMETLRGWGLTHELGGR